MYLTKRLLNKGLKRLPAVPSEKRDPEWEDPILPRLWADPNLHMTPMITGWTAVLLWMCSGSMNSDDSRNKSQRQPSTTLLWMVFSKKRKDFQLENNEEGCMWVLKSTQKQEDWIRMTGLPGDIFLCRSKSQCVVPFWHTRKNLSQLEL